jgi:hypothetical protein
LFHHFILKKLLLLLISWTSEDVEELGNPLKPNLNRLVTLSKIKLKMIVSNFV